MKVKLLILLVIGLFAAKLQSQTSECYSMYSFDQFLESKTDSALYYLGGVYRNITYPINCREQGIEEDIKVLMIHHSDQEIEIIPRSDQKELKTEIIDAINAANQKSLLKTDEKFIVEIPFKFDLEPFEKNVDGRKIIWIEAYIPERPKR